MRYRMWKKLLMLVLAAPLSGCGAVGAMFSETGKTPPAQTGAAPQAGPVRSVETFRREPAPAQASLQAPAGQAGADRSSLWSDTSPFLFHDRRAARVGDLITVVISESSNAKKEADTENKRSASLAYTAPSLPGYGRILATPSHGRGRRFNQDDTLRATSRNEHTSESEIERTDTLNATVSARVVEILPNGNLFIEGRKELSTHKETLIVTVSGIVRVEDIDTNNTIQSKSLADARIVYTGDGIMAEAQQPGWLGRVMNVLWPF
ncbi:MAG: flagellar basal body L-ring protein FlgH [Nitrospinota bacterium]